MSHLVTNHHEGTSMFEHAHLCWMDLAIEMVDIHSSNNIPLTNLDRQEALQLQEVPVGCVFVRDGAVVAKARNRTNELRNVRYTGTQRIPTSWNTTTIGNTACRAGSHWCYHFQSGAYSTRSSWCSATLWNNTIRHCRALHYVRLSPSSSWDQGGVFRM